MFLLLNAIPAYRVCLLWKKRGDTYSIIYFIFIINTFLPYSLTHWCLWCLVFCTWTSATVRQVCVSSFHSFLHLLPSTFAFLFNQPRFPQKYFAIKHENNGISCMEWFFCEVRLKMWNFNWFFLVGDVGRLVWKGLEAYWGSWETNCFLRWVLVRFHHFGTRTSDIRFIILS